MSGRVRPCDICGEMTEARILIDGRRVPRCKPCKIASVSCSVTHMMFSNMDNIDATITALTSHIVETEAAVSPFLLFARYIELRQLGFYYAYFNEGDYLKARFVCPLCNQLSRVHESSGTLKCSVCAKTTGMSEAGTATIREQRRLEEEIRVTQHRLGALMDAKSAFEKDPLGMDRISDDSSFIKKLLDGL